MKFIQTIVADSGEVLVTPQNNGKFQIHCQITDDYGLLTELSAAVHHVMKEVRKRNADPTRTLDPTNGATTQAVSTALVPVYPVYRTPDPWKHDPKTGDISDGN